jgi:hypothetical protein
MNKLPAKIIVTYERRHDCGLRAYSEDAPGFLLSHKDHDVALKDVIPACGTPIVVRKLVRLREDDVPLVPSDLNESVHREYVSLSCTTRCSVLTNSSW